MPQRPAYRFEQFFATRRITALSPAPDGQSLLFVSDISGQFNLWGVPSGGGWPEQLTLFTEDAVLDAILSPDGSRIALQADHHGDEKHQIYLMNAVGGWPEKITDRPDVQYNLTSGSFSPCGRYLAFSGNADNPQDVDIYLYDLQSGETRRITGGGGLVYFACFSPDSTRILAVQSYSTTDKDLILIDLASGRVRNLTQHPGRQVNYQPGFWEKDGSGFWFLTNDGREFDGLAYYDLAADRWSYVVTADWGIEQAALNHDQSLLAYMVNESGNSTLHVIERATGREIDLPPMPKGVISAATFAGRDSRNRLFLQITTYREATTICVLDLAEISLTRATQSMLGNLPEAVFVAPELVHIESFDGLMIPAWLYSPHGVAPAGEFPALLAIHGGPEFQERTGYSSFYQYLLSQGIAVLAPNIRGSTGFGSDYQKRIHRDWGGAELRDIEACNRYLRSLDWIDAERIGVFGGSYGGFATLSALTRLPDLWACGCDFCGPSNLVTFVSSLPPTWRPMMKSRLGDPEEDRAFLLERSPITYIEQIVAPLMVVQGAMDPRVVKAESDQMVEGLRSMGRPVEYLVFEDEGHGFNKRTNMLKGLSAMADFLIRHLKG